MFSASTMHLTSTQCWSWGQPQNRKQSWNYTTDPSSKTNSKGALVHLHCVARLNSNRGKHQPHHAVWLAVHCHTHACTHTHYTMYSVNVYKSAWGIQQAVIPCRICTVCVCTYAHTYLNQFPNLAPLNIQELCSEKKTCPWHKHRQ